MAPHVFAGESPAGSGVWLEEEEGLPVGASRREASALHTPCTFFPQNGAAQGQGSGPSNIRCPPGAF